MIVCVLISVFEPCLTCDAHVSGTLASPCAASGQCGYEAGLPLRHYKGKEGIFIYHVGTRFVLHLLLELPWVKGFKRPDQILIKGTLQLLV